jgi:hypothetical protein
MLKVIIGEIVFSSKESLSLHGTDKLFGQRDCGNHLSTIQLTSYYGKFRTLRVLRDHAENYKYDSLTYFS